MSNNQNVHQTQLPKIVDNGTYNNFREWEAQSYHKLCEWDLLKYIEGPESQPPIIPTLHCTIAHCGVSDDGNMATFHISGNEDEDEQALTDITPWMTGNNTVHL
jgi:hypothetical protein